LKTISRKSSHLQFWNLQAKLTSEILKN